MKKSELDGICVDASELVQLRLLAKDFHLSKARASLRSLAGAHSSRARGRGMSFAEVRHYQAGDDVRNIDWRVTARTQRTHTKLFEEEKERPVFVLLDQRKSMFFGSQVQFKSVLAARLAALCCWQAYAGHDRIGSLIFNDHSQCDLRPRQGKKSSLQFINHIVEYNQQLHQQNPQVQQASSDTNTAFSLDTMLEEALRIARPGSLIYLISDFHDLSQSSEKSLALLARHNELRFFHVSDPLEAHLPKLGSVNLSNGDEQIQVNLNSKRFQKEYSHSWHQLNETIEALCLKYKITYHAFSTAHRVNELIHSNLSPALEQSNTLKEAK
ncbi:DUF58 domain-containing protein [Agaribacterium sp. ZY112]|uniref:DUF58 domain-containing protein n=1 Tax=Agaribacterium sp. ZY112 TaxID=3233574 RepID=UPI003525921D